MIEILVGTLTAVGEFYAAIATSLTGKNVKKRDDFYSYKK